MIAFFDGTLEIHDHFAQVDAGIEDQKNTNSTESQIHSSVKEIFSKTNENIGVSYKIEIPKVYSFGYDMDSDFVKDGKRQCEGCQKFFFIESFYRHVSHSKKCSSAYDVISKESEVNAMKNRKKFDESKKKTKPIFNSESKVCDGCKKVFTNDSFFKHVSHAKKCKEAYGDKWEKMKRQKRQETTGKYLASSATQ